LFIADISSTASICRIGFIFRSNVNTVVSTDLSLSISATSGHTPSSNVRLVLIRLISTLRALASFSSKTPRSIALTIM
jgi:hypothetical protein